MSLAAASWPVWGMTARITVTRAESLPEAELIACRILEEVGRACSRFREDSELATTDFSSGAEASPMLVRLMRRALDSAALTDGAVDPTLGRALASAGYDRDFALLPAPEMTTTRGVQVSLAPRPTTSLLRSTPTGDAAWTRVRLEGSVLTIPSGVEIDLGATAKAVAADLIASEVAEQCQTGVLVNLSGDLASAGAVPEGGWQILVRDLPEDPAQQVSLGPGGAVATSSTQKRRWAADSGTAHHILDPWLGVPAEPHWKSVSVAAVTCWGANTYSTAAIVKGQTALTWLARRGMSARLVDRQGRVFYTGAWPQESLTPATARA